MNRLVNIIEMVVNISTSFPEVNQGPSSHRCPPRTGVGSPQTGPFLSSRTTTRIYPDGLPFVTVPCIINLLMNKLTSVFFPTVSWSVETIRFSPLCPQFTFESR